MGGSETYEIRIEGQLSPSWTLWFEGMTLCHEESGETLLVGELPDQSALHGILMRVRDLGLPLLSVRRLPTLSQDHKHGEGEGK
jgi:hypothetical protein